MRGRPRDPVVWLGQSVRTTLVVSRFPELANLPFMASMGDAVHRPRLINRVFRNGLRAKLQVTGPLMLDSGGFTMMTRKVQGWTADLLGSLYLHCGADYVVALDEPAILQDTPFERRQKHARTLDNLAVLARVIDVSRIVPVIHGPEIGDIERNAEAIRLLVPNPRMIALGGLVPILRYSATRTIKARHHLESAISIVRATYPESAIHILGAGAPRTMLAALACGADSVDSIGWRRAAGFGTIFIAGAGERFVDEHARRRPGSRVTITSAEKSCLIRCDCPACSQESTVERRIKRLRSHYMNRAAHNAWTLHREVAAFRAAELCNNLHTFLGRRLPAEWLPHLR